MNAARVAPATRRDDADLIIVGAGPRALYALADLEEALADRGHDRGGPARPMRVMVVDPAAPGAGAVWDRAQGEHLLMNVSSHIVDASSPSVPWTFTQWQEHDGEVETFPARARAGRYLSWAFERLSDSPWLEVRHVVGSVADVTRDGEAWVCAVRGEAPVTLRATRVLLATGHAGGAGLDHAAIADASSGPAPGEPVTVHGAALTAFDVVMDLTAARGGTWGEDGTYAPSGREPSLITLVSRTGEPMLPKPVSAPSSVIAAVRARTARWLPDAVPHDAWWQVLADAAVAAALEAGVRVTHEELWERLDSPTLDGDPSARWTRDIGRAEGDVDADPAWWWGRAWSAGYADVVRSLERGPRDADTWPRWRRRAAMLERWAFGPPLVTHRRLVALRDAGLLRVVAAPDAVAGEPAIDAFTRGPGVLEAPHPWEGEAAAEATGASADRAPWQGLIDAGEVTVRAGERGVLTRVDGACLRRDGSVAHGLAALGRPTEDPVIGHDSLQRGLHDDSRRWARALACAWGEDGDAGEPACEEVLAHG
ncbi:FAD/NAD(P)-binding protein [Demequina sp. NBRC 110057]|uniref:FAD/NAD(P)-binding protein n=1 Tax=Demequina sp. NBRC 110057 TaxID=1570346 RepID=UPI00135654C6|nr:FAD/NAD(P)-binding protein [Demequina sp. NBRC 110057]